MKNLRIIFMGTPDFALESLKQLVENEYNVVGVVTIPDKNVGRGQKLQSSPVKIYAEKNQIPVFQPTNLKNEDFVNSLKELNPDLQIVVAFRMLPKVVWQLPKYGTFNLHASLLPNYRGSAPINWAIINGEEKTGVTTFFIDEKIDTGAIILQSETVISEKETAGSLHDKLMIQGAELVLKTVDEIEKGNHKVRKQPMNDVFAEAPKIFKETCRINWEKEGIAIERLIRGMSPYPTAWTILLHKGEEMNIKIYDATFQKESHSLPNGKIKIQNRQIYVAVKEGFVNLLELQIPGKKRIKASDLLNGFSFDEEAKFI
ncbi:methionyl-tRNA formyltransferase [Capnocytophaga felis]|uniref:Methionyl-tRNA formyltransferase n=1 Tax=Capnocytophaga felis TaxID=2267611 RepID=A0A5M4B5F3_9FLAO|nr:methionyl-tRNA formyltransferase [Capnocytophaga felis]GET44824.1 methionyl-tRNA formyltransferase [Capnocytophaga felis]GET48649.1 methionyl-tRNA formyltransferase [Capnocytophaga felis]